MQKNLKVVMQIKEYKILAKSETIPHKEDFASNEVPLLNKMEVFTNESDNPK